MVVAKTGGGREICLTAQRSLRPIQNAMGINNIYVISIYYNMIELYN